METSGDSQPVTFPGDQWLGTHWTLIGLGFIGGRLVAAFETRDRNGLRFSIRVFVERFAIDFEVVD